MYQQPSERFELNSVDMWKIGKGLLIAIAGSVLAVVSQEIIPYLDQLGMPILIPVLSTLTNAAVKWLQGRR